MTKERNNVHQARHGFRHMIELFHYYAMIPTLTPIAQIMARAMAWPLRHRGKGRGAIEHKHGAARSKYVPHQGARECARRAFATKEAARQLAALSQ